MRRATILLVVLAAAACAPKPSAPAAPAPKAPGTTDLTIAAMDSAGNPVIAATVKLDGIVVGTTPLERRVSAGEHVLEAHRGDLRGEVPLQVQGDAMFYAIQLRTPPEKRIRPEDAPPLGKGMDPAVIDARIKEDLGPIKACYDAALGRAPKLHGKLVISFLIEPDGSVGYAYVKSAHQLLDDEVHSCIEKVFMKMSFPVQPDTGIVRVNYPLMFRTASF